MKEILLDFASYNVWANKIMCDFILTLPVEIQIKNVPNSFAGLHLVLYHMWYAESVWWQRIKLNEVVESPIVNKEDTEAIVAGLLKQSAAWKDWISTSNDNALQHVFMYYNSKKEHFKQPVFQVLLHLFNHQSYHRGQLVTIFHQSGVQKIPGTDVIEYYRSKRK